MNKVTPNLPPLFDDVDRIVDLPVYSGTDITNRLPQDTTNFVRQIGLRVSGGTPWGSSHLNDLLKSTQRELEHAAMLCGAETIQPTWGLIDMDDFERKHGALPPGVRRNVYEQRRDYARFTLDQRYTLAARVALLTAVEPIKSDSPESASIINGTREYYDPSSIGVSNVILSDIRIEQFVTGIDATDTTGIRKPFLVDPDAYVALRDLSVDYF